MMITSSQHSVQSETQNQEMIRGSSSFVPGMILAIVAYMRASSFAGDVVVFFVIIKHNSSCRRWIYDIRA